MILIDNRNILRLKNRELLNRLTEIENKKPTGTVIVEQSKTDVLTMKIIINGKMQYIHSKYDPEKDAERVIKEYENDIYKHVLFIGTGLGYHIKKFVEMHPNTKFSIYEPNVEVLLVYLKYANLNELPLHNLIHIFTGDDCNNIVLELQKVLQVAKGMLLLITLPVYEKIYVHQIAAINESLIDALKNKRLNLATVVSHQKRWTVNSIKNFPKLLKTSNILHDIDRSLFRGKPALIVAAGPSLNEEFENLRYIKENGLAYIFSVGSAINSLIDQGIYPDAICSFDPTEENHFVVQKIREQNISNIPLVFGSSIGFETLENYPGKMLHMITGPDTVSPQLLDTTQSIDIVWDAPTVAAVTFQLLSHLQCNPIVLVGQNLAYLGDVRYAAGIDYNFIKNELNEEEKRLAITVKDVEGNDIQTSDSFNSMRRQLEIYIQMNKNAEVINTTKNGAHIEGTTFLYLEEWMKERLNVRINKYNWTDELNSYDNEFTVKRLQLLTDEKEKSRKQIQRALDELEKIEFAIKEGRNKSIEKMFVSFDRQFSKLKRNPFYIGFIEPMIKVQNERLSEESQFVRYEADISKKAGIVVQSFGAFLHEVNLHQEFIALYFEEMKKEVEEFSSRE